jgi:hypothetical protein
MPRIILDRKTVEWGPRRASRVRILCRLTDMEAGRLDVSLDLPRECFRTDERVRGALARLLTMLMAMMASRRRAARQTVVVRCRLRLAGRPRATLRVSSATFNTLRQHRFERTSRARVRTMATRWFHQCVGQRIADLIRTPPRAGGPTRRLLTSLLPGAFLAAYRLVTLVDIPSAELQARAERLFPVGLGALGFDVDGLRVNYVTFVQDVGKRMKQILDQEDDLHDYVFRHAYAGGYASPATKRALIVALVHRGFKGAWKTPGHPGLLRDNRPPVNWLRKYLYGQQARPIDFIDWLRREHPAEYLGQLLAWGRDFLTTPGHAAVTFGLLGAPSLTDRA